MEIETTDPNQLDRVLSVQQVTEILNLSRPELRLKVLQGELPSPIKIESGRARRIGWKQSVISNWIKERGPRHERHQEKIKESR